VDGLPSSYRVKSISYGVKDITGSTFPLSAANFSNPSTTRAFVINFFAGVANAAVPPSNLSITLEYALPSKPLGVRVTGTLSSIDNPTVYISGIPGIVFSDGTFEFRDVPPGRHLIAAMHRFTPQAAVVVVGDRDIDRVTLMRTLAQPDISGPQVFSAPGPYPPGTVIQLPRILGSVVEETTGMPIPNGLITVENEDYKRTFSLDSNGRFESFALFPGNYDVSLWLLGHVSTTRKVTIEDQDVQVRLAVSPED